MRRLNVDRMRRYSRRGRTAPLFWIERPARYPSAHFTVLADGTVLDHTPFLATDVEEVEREQGVNK